MNKKHVLTCSQTSYRRGQAAAGCFHRSPESFLTYGGVPVEGWVCCSRETVINRSVQVTHREASNSSQQHSHSLLCLSLWASVWSVSLGPFVVLSESYQPGTKLTDKRLCQRLDSKKRTSTLRQCQTLLWREVGEKRLETGFLCEAFQLQRHLNRCVWGKFWTSQKLQDSEFTQRGFWFLFSCSDFQWWRIPT